MKTFWLGILAVGLALGEVAPDKLDLARSLVKRARATDDVKFLDEAERALAGEKDSFETRKVRVTVLLARGEYRAALDLARELNKQIPDDVSVYGMVADACMALGEYKEAETAAQWMLDLRRGNLGGLQRGAFLRELFGDYEGALEWMTSVYKLTSANDREERAWLLAHIARMSLASGKVEAAGKQAAQALTLLPEYHFALKVQADVLSAQGKHAEAAETLRRVVKVSRSPRYLYALGLEMRAAGEPGADGVLAEFEKSARGKADRELVLYYADVAGKPEESMAVAKAASEKRKDAYTLDALAWALFKSGRRDEARAEMKRATEVGIRDPEILRHAAEIK